MTTNIDLDQAREWAKWVIQADSQVEVDPDLRGAANVIQSLPDEWIDAEKLREVIEEYDSWESGAFVDDLRALLPGTQPRTLADTKWDDNVHPYMEAVTASGRRHILLAPMGNTSVSENTILVAEHDGGVPVLVPAENLSPTGRYARLFLPPPTTLKRT